MSTKEQSGKDLEIGQEAMDLRKLVLPAGKIIISVTDKDLEEHHAVVPIPKSYEAAMAIAFDQLGDHIATTGDPLLKDVYFKYWMKCPSGKDVWAKLAPEFWKEVVKDGDQLKLFRKPHLLLAKFVQVGERGYVLDSITARLPTTYKDAKRVALAMFYAQIPTEGMYMHLCIMIGNAWVPAESPEEENWTRLVAEADRKQPYVEIGVFVHWSDY